MWTLDARKDDFLPSAEGASIVRGGVVEVDLFDITRERARIRNPPSHSPIEQHARPVSSDF